jgi:hypothetical protein
MYGPAASDPRLPGKLRRRLRQLARWVREIVRLANSEVSKLHEAATSTEGLRSQLNALAACRAWHYGCSICVDLMKRCQGCETTATPKAKIKTAKTTPGAMLGLPWPLTNEVLQIVMRGEDKEDKAAA